MRKYCLTQLNTEQVEQAKRMADNGMSVRQIARTFNVSFYQAYKHLRGTSSHRELWGANWETKQKRVVQLYDQGYAPIGICAMVATHYDECVQMLIEAGKPFNVKPRISVTTANKMAERWNSGRTMDEIAQEFRVTTSKVYRALKYRKLL